MSVLTNDNHDGNQILDPEKKYFSRINIYKGHNKFKTTDGDKRILECPPAPRDFLVWFFSIRQSPSLQVGNAGRTWPLPSIAPLN